LAINGEFLHQNAINKDRYKVWFKQADFDFHAATLSMEHGYYEWSTYQAEQSVEKAFKAIIAHAGWQPPRMHKIPILLGICNNVNLRCHDTIFRFKHIESFTFISRYPFLIPGKRVTPHELINEEDARKALNQAGEILDKVGEILRFPVTEMHGDIKVIESYNAQQIENRLIEIKNKIINELNPEKIVLFGGYAREYPEKKTGTMDILIIADTKLSFIQRIKKVRTITRGQSPVIEPLIYTPEEFQYMKDEEGEGFLESAVREGRVIFEKDVTQIS